MCILRSGLRRRPLLLLARGRSPHAPSSVSLLCPRCASPPHTLSKACRDPRARPANGDGGPAVTNLVRSRARRPDCRWERAQASRDGAKHCLPAHDLSQPFSHCLQWCRKSGHQSGPGLLYLSTILAGDDCLRGHGDPWEKHTPIKTWGHLQRKWFVQKAWLVN
jgi:hypothetical protein